MASLVTRDRVRPLPVRHVGPIASGWFQSTLVQPLACGRLSALGKSGRHHVE
jgi:hypothetical protein